MLEALNGAFSLSPQFIWVDCTWTPWIMCRQWWHSEAPRGRADLRLQGRPGHVRHVDIGTRGCSSPEAIAVAALQAGATACVARPVLVNNCRCACAVGPGKHFVTEASAPCPSSVGKSERIAARTIRVSARDTERLPNIMFEVCR